MSASARHFSAGRGMLCESSLDSESHTPKREGELLKHTKLLRSPKQRFVLTPGLARVIREVIWPDESLREEMATIITANEGPGFLPQELLDNGASKVLALCRQEQFGPALERVRMSAPEDGFQWRHADIHQMQFTGDREIQPPIVRTEEVFQDVDPVAWEDDIPVKVIGALPQDGERTQAYVLSSLILERLSLYSYGRVQLNLFMSRNCYNTIIQPPGNMKNYRAISALYQVSCDIKLLHKEPKSSFKLPPKRQTKMMSSKEPKESDSDDLLLVQITPKRELFSRYQLDHQVAFTFVFFVRQALAKRKERLSKVIEAFAPGSGDIVSEYGYDRKTVTGDVTGDDLLAIFCRISQMENFNGAWMGEEVMGWSAVGRAQDVSTSELSQALEAVDITTPHHTSGSS
ncbi:dimethyladenosine transferase 2, mitochondrial-like [Diadema antillarum]|uniref:dimethyladenosine transferase 2, mitochondrial-like n=1 Tax=Diadema antillarum TaxID=105358 RepID=UPI003A8579B9